MDHTTQDGPSVDGPSSTSTARTTAATTPVAARIRRQGDAVAPAACSAAATPRAISCWTPNSTLTMKKKSAQKTAKSA